MSPLIHILLSFIFSLILFPIYGLWVWIIFISSVLIDIDHPIDYFIRFKSFNIKKSYAFARDNAPVLCDKALLMLHTIEFLIILLILTIYLKAYSQIFLLIFIGSAFHLTVDFTEVYIKYKKFRQFSLIWWLYRPPKIDRHYRLIK